MTKPLHGATFVSRTTELDTDENGNDRITPAGSLWHVMQVDDVIHLVCQETGAWICPDERELERDFTPFYSPSTC